MSLKQNRFHKFSSPIRGISSGDRNGFYFSPVVKKNHEVDFRVQANVSMADLYVSPEEVNIHKQTLQLA